MLACGVAAPATAIATTLVAMAADPRLNPARHYISELGGIAAPTHALFNDGVLVTSVLATLAGGGFGLALGLLTQARIVALLTAGLFAMSGFGMAEAAVFPWPDPRHMAINLALGIEFAPLLLVWGLRSRNDAARLRVFLIAAFAVMALLAVLPRHLLLPRLFNDANVGWWERIYALVLVGWVAVAAVSLDRRLRDAMKAVSAA